MTASDDVEVEVCRDFQKGNCSRGNKCKFSHPNLTDVTTPTSNDAEVEVCRDFKKGNCSRGNKCKFSHPNLTDITTTTSDYAKVEVCKDFLTRGCSRQNCKFFHATQDLSYGGGILPAHLQAAIAAGSSDIIYGKRFRDDSFNLTRDLSPLAKKAVMVENEMETGSLCRDFRNGNCYRGDKCKYFHPTLGLGLSEVNSPCFDFGKGKCSRGTACKYFHPTLKICRDFQNDKCERETCRFLHMTREEEATYTTSGQVPDHIDEMKLKSCKIVDSATDQGVGNNGAILGKQFDISDVLGQGFDMLTTFSTASALQENKMLKLKFEELQSHITDLRKMNDTLYEQNMIHRKEALLSI